MKIIINALGLAGLAFSSALAAHGGATLRDGVDVKASALAGYTHLDREQDALWQVPGVLLGGDAHGAEPGFALHEATLSLLAGSDSGSFALLETGVHGHADASDIELEQALVGWTMSSGAQDLTFTAGRMTAIFSEEYGRHASDASFTRKPLVYDLFLGRHHNDTGARATWQMQLPGHQTLNSGLELYRGDAFPATTGTSANAGDLFGHWRYQGDQHSAGIGLWYYFGKASERTDQRLTSDHSHSGTTNVSNVRFTGDTGIAGLSGHWRWLYTEAKSLTLSGEYLQVNAKGRVQDDTHLAQLRGKHAGAWLQVALACASHELALRYDRVVLDNHLSGSGATVLADSANLQTDDHEPQMFSFAWQWQFDPDLALRLEQSINRSTDRTLSESQVNLVWRRAWTF